MAKLFNQLKSRKPMDLAAASSSSSATPSGHAYPQRKPMLAMIRKKLKAQKKSKVQKETALGGGTRKGRSLFGTSGERGTPQAWSVPAIGSDRELSASMLCRELVEELGVGATLVQFCRDLPVVRELSSCSNGDLSGFWLGATGAEEGEVKIAPLIKKLVIVVSASSFFFFFFFLATAFIVEFLCCYCLFVFGFPAKFSFHIQESLTHPNNQF